MTESPLTVSTQIATSSTTSTSQTAPPPPPPPPAAAATAAATAAAAAVSPAPPAPLSASASASHDAPSTNGGAAPDLVDEEPYTIKCICDYSDDDGNTIYCETCDTWQHIEC